MIYVSYLYPSTEGIPSLEGVKANHVMSLWLFLCAWGNLWREDGLHSELWHIKTSTWSYMNVMVRCEYKGNSKWEKPHFHLLPFNEHLQKRFSTVPGSQSIGVTTATGSQPQGVRSFIHLIQLDPQQALHGNIQHWHLTPTATLRLIQPDRGKEEKGCGVAPSAAGHFTMNPYAKMEERDSVCVWYIYTHTYIWTLTSWRKNTQNIFLHIAFNFLPLLQRQAEVLMWFIWIIHSFTSENQWLKYLQEQQGFTKQQKR